MTVTNTPPDLSSLFAPRGIAVIGASRQPRKLGSVLVRSLERFAGSVVQVNKRDPDPSQRRFASVSEAASASADPIDLAVVCVPAEVCATALQEAAEGGVCAVLVCSGGFAESGPDGARHQQALLEEARRAGVRLLGPNTSGFLVPHLDLSVSFVPGAAAIPPGRVAVVAASGGVNHALSFMLAHAGVGVSLAVGVGNGIDIDAVDILDYINDDPLTGAVALYVESVSDGRALMEAVSRLTERIPVIALVVGRSDISAFAESHTGALATSWRVTRAGLRQAGAVLVDDERALVDACVALSAVRLEPTLRASIGVVTAQAGPGLLLLDHLLSKGVSIPELTASTRRRLGETLPPLTYTANPVDTGRPDDAFGRVLSAVGNDPAIDLVAGYALLEPDAVDLTQAAQSASRDGRTPLVLGLGGLADEVAAQREALHKCGVPALTSPTSLGNAVLSLVADARGRTFRASASYEPAASVPIPRDSALDEDQAKDLLGRLGVPTPARRVCSSREEAQDAWLNLGRRVAVKILDAAITHKTDVGGVHLGISDHAALDIALDALARIGARHFLIEEMAPSGVDLIVGARRDPIFGPVVTLGVGGVMAEAMSDVAVRIAPLDAAEATMMPDDLATPEVLDGWRSGPLLDRAELARILIALGQTLIDNPHVTDIEVNPLRLTHSGLLALDAVVTMDAKQNEHRGNDH